MPEASAAGTGTRPRTRRRSSRSRDSAPGNTPRADAGSRVKLSRLMLPATPRGAIACAFLLIALAVGGGGSPSPIAETIVQVSAAAATIVWLFAGPPGAPAISSDWRVRACAATVLAMPLLQLVPLPSALWQSLPGREAEAASLALAGLGDSWMPWSMTPGNTLASLLAMIPPVLFLLAVPTLARQDRSALVASVAMFVGATVVVGALQMAGGPGSAWRFYEGPIDTAIGETALLGFQANRNATADILLIGLAACAVLAVMLTQRIGARIALTMLTGCALLVTVATILTGSRAGMTLLALVMLAAVVIWKRDPISPQRTMAFAAGGAVLAGLFALVVQGNLGLRKALSRFALDRDFRFELWEDARYAIDGTWPFGAGMGSFRPVFIAAERLEVVDPTVPNRVHNDYLELMLESGLPGVAALVVAVFCVVVLAVEAWRRRDEASRPLIVFALTTLSVIALHSIVDYPLRSMSLAMLAALAAGLLAACTWQGAEAKSEAAEDSPE